VIGRGKVHTRLIEHRTGGCMRSGKLALEAKLALSTAADSEARGLPRRELPIVSCGLSSRGDRFFSVCMTSGVPAPGGCARAC